METLEKLGFNTIVLLYFVAGVIGGMARVARRHGWRGFCQQKLIADAIFSALGGVLYPYALPNFVTANFPPVVSACGIAFVTYWLNDLFIRKLKQWFGYNDFSGDHENGVPSQSGHLPGGYRPPEPPKYPDPPPPPTPIDPQPPQPPTGG